MGDLIDSLPPGAIFVCDKGYRHDVREIARMVIGNDCGAFKCPYTKRPFSRNEIAQILACPVQHPGLREFLIQLPDQGKELDPRIAEELRKVARACSKDYDQDSGYVKSATALMELTEYLETLSPDHREIARNLVVIYKDPDENSKTISRRRLGVLIDDLSAGRQCNHIAAVYLWSLAQRLDPSCEEVVPREIQFTSTYWKGLFCEETALVPAWLLELLQLRNEETLINYSEWEEVAPEDRLITSDRCWWDANELTHKVMDRLIKEGNPYTTMQFSEEDLERLIAASEGKYGKLAAETPPPATGSRDTTWIITLFGQLASAFCEGSEADGFLAGSMLLVDCREQIAGLDASVQQTLLTRSVAMGRNRGDWTLEHVLRDIGQQDGEMNMHVVGVFFQKLQWALRGQVEQTTETILLRATHHGVPLPAPQ